MNHVYHTRGIVLASFPHSEYDKRLVILTADFGVIRVTAQAVRKIESKLRPTTQDFSEADFFLVHGKSGWRLTNTTHIRNLYTTLAPERFVMLARIGSLIARLMPEEDATCRAYTYVFEAIDSDTTDIEALEIITNIRILNDLGYIGEDAVVNPLIQNPLSEATFVHARAHQKTLITRVNQAIRESHL